MISTFLLRMALATSLYPAAVVVHAACNYGDTADCDVCPEGVVPGKYSSGKPCKCGVTADAASAGELCKNGEVRHPDCCHTDGSKETEGWCRCGDDMNSVVCDLSTYCDTSDATNPLCRSRPRCKPNDGSKPVPDDEAPCECGQSHAYLHPGYEFKCLESESKVSSDKTCTGGADEIQEQNCLCSKDSTVVEGTSLYQKCLAGQKCNTDATSFHYFCSWPACTDGEGPSSSKLKCECGAEGQEMDCKYGQICSEGMCECKPTKTTVCHYSGFEADEACSSACKYDLKSLDHQVLEVGVCDSDSSSSINFIREISKKGDEHVLTSKMYEKTDADDKSCDGKIISTGVRYIKSDGCSGYEFSKESILSDGRKHSANLINFACLFVFVLSLL